MNKSELIVAIAKKSGLTQANAGKVLAVFCDSVTETLGKGNDVQITGFGSFSISDHAARTGRNPQTGETIQIVATKMPKFKPSKNLKNAVNG